MKVEPNDGSKYDGNVLYHRIDTTDGMSGSAIYSYKEKDVPTPGFYIIGVHIGGPRDHSTDPTDFNRAVRYSKPMQEFIKANSNAGK